MSEVIDAGNTAGPVTSTEPEVKTDGEALKPEAATSEKPGNRPEETVPQDKFLKKINKLTWQREEAKREAEMWRTRALQAQGITKEQDKREVSQGKPEASKFESYEAYLEALTDWKAEQKFAEREKKTKEDSSKRDRVERLQQAASTFEERAEKFREKVEDFDDVVYDESLPVTQAMSEAILDSDIGPELLYHLGQNPKEAARIARLSPFAAAREIGKLEVKLSTPAPKKPSNAPDPITPVGGKEKVTTDMEKIPIGEWMKRRNEQVRK